MHPLAAGSFVPCGQDFALITNDPSDREITIDLREFLHRAHHQLTRLVVFSCRLSLLKHGSSGAGPPTRRAPSGTGCASLSSRRSCR